MNFYTCDTGGIFPETKNQNQKFYKNQKSKSDFIYQGVISMSKIKDYGFEQDVLELRAKGYSYRVIADTLNSKIPDGDEPMSEMVISRFLKAHKEIKYVPVIDDESLSPNGVDKSDDVNPYEETIKLINDCDLQIELLKRRIEPIRTGKALSTLDHQNLDKLHQYIARKQSLLSDIAKFQKEMTSFSEVKEMMRIVYDCMMVAAPEAYELFKQKVAERQNMKTIMKPIMNTK